jgi:hypothetical protein
VVTGEGLDTPPPLELDPPPPSKLEPLPPLELEPLPEDFELDPSPELAVAESVAD